MLELWEDTKGKKKGQKYFRGRWLFYPRHLPETHAEAKRKRTGLDARQVYEQCDAIANDDENPLASLRSVQRVLCCWKDSRNRLPSEEELRAAHAWFDSAWDDDKHEVVPLSTCVDKPNSGTLHASQRTSLRWRASPRFLSSDASPPACSSLRAPTHLRDRPAAHPRSRR